MVAKYRQVSFYVNDADFVFLENARKKECKTRAQFCYDAIVKKLYEKVEVLANGVSESGSNGSNIQ